METICQYSYWLGLYIDTMKNIAIITSSEFPACEGIGTYVMSIARIAVAKGHKVTIISRSLISPELKDNGDQGIDFLEIKTLKIPIINNIIFAIKLKQLISQHQFDVVNIQTPLVYFPRMGGFKTNILVTVHSTMRFDTAHIEVVSLKAALNKLAGLTYSPLFENHLFKMANKIICVSDDVRAEVCRYGKKFGEKTLVIPNCIDFDIFYPHNKNRGNQILCIGRIGYRKGILNMARSISLKSRELRNTGYKILFVGHGPLIPDLKRFIKEKELNDLVEVYSVPQAEVPALMSESKFSMMCSTYETGPRVVLEAMACATPVIATSVGLVKNFPNDIFIKVDDSSVEKIGEALIRAIELSEEEYDYMSRRALDYVRFNHDIEKVWSEYYNVF